jgi:hypothetical protein
MKYSHGLSCALGQREGRRRGITRLGQSYYLRGAEKGAGRERTRATEEAREPSAG